MMAEFVTKNDGREYQDVSEGFKNIVQEQGNMEAREMFTITDAIRQTCYQSATH